MIEETKCRQAIILTSSLLPYFFLVLLLLSTSCHVQLLPAYEEKITESIGQTARKVDLLYILLLETDINEPEGRIYNRWMETYAGIEADLGLLLLQSANQPLNQHSVKICESTLETWQKYKAQHKKDNIISDANITLNRMYMSDFFHAMLVAEKAKKMAASTQTDKK